MFKDANESKVTALSCVTYISVRAFSVSSDTEGAILVVFLYFKVDHKSRARV